MIIYTKTILPVGLEGQEITVEIDSNRSLPTIEIIGLPDSSIRESKERLRATFRHCGIEIPSRKFIINLAPSNVKKSGTIFDLAIATALFICIGGDSILYKDLCAQTVMFGELGLDGTIKGVQGVFAGVMAGIKRGYKIFFVPEENQKELEFLTEIEVYPISHFNQIVGLFAHGILLQKCVTQDTNINLYNNQEIEVDINDIVGHTFAKRAIAIAASGMHNILLVGSPGGGKTMLAKALKSILPPMHFEEMLQVSHIHSLAGKLSSNKPILQTRPFRTVHHTASKIAIAGGGQHLLPGEISLAHKGILFFDELSEFPREVLEVLRQPLEDKIIHISRANGHVSYPANCMFVGAMNPCSCGHYGDTEKLCSCSVASIKRYQSKISGPLLDRMDLILTIGKHPSISGANNNYDSEHLRLQVLRARDIQQARYKNTPYTTNADVKSKDIDTYMPLNEACKNILVQATKKLQISMRVIHKTIKLARSIADFAGEPSIRKEHLLEALQYRTQGRLVRE